MTVYFLTLPHPSDSEPTMDSLRETDPEAIAAVIEAVGAFNQSIKDAGAWVYAGGLYPPSTAKNVDATSGETVVRNEPFVVAESYLGGFWLIDVATEGEAIDWAAKASAVVQSPVEVRALQEPPAEHDKYEA
ncbi:YciI family protein [Agromyces sp. LHK192]|uniref:YciI family protein n=1 Tax=Agromyces sp. LHK192 TaxID=2498704 RepID=UPI000FDB7A7E|nr:YciI family protein [Agromyces sp. LHK192]